MTPTGRALVLIHERENGPATLGHHLVDRGWDLDLHHVLPDDRPDRPAPFPDLDPYDLVVPLASIQAVYDEATIGSWIGREVAHLADAHRMGLPVLGICFGGQALAAALGGRVEPAPRGELGWFHFDGDHNPIGPGPWFEWHHDRFEPPPGAEVLATTPDAVQLFRIGSSVGTQFHPEIDLAHVSRWVAMAGGDELAGLGADAATLLAETAAEETRAVAACRRLVDWFLDDVVGC